MGKKQIRIVFAFSFHVFNIIIHLLILSNNIQIPINLN